MTDIDAALRKKEMGNESYKNGDFTTALTLFNEAIDLDGNNETFYCNRSMCHAALKDWWSSISDARKAILMNPKYVKAHFRLIKALLELKLYKEGRLCLLNAFNVCGDSKEFKVLDDEITLESGVPVRPKPNDFDIVDDLGEGNFSKIFRAIYKPTGCSFAMKVIEKATIEKTKKRHKNVNNEILKEKRVLNKLDHPNVVTLLATFQDYGSLYYQMEYLSGGELYDTLYEKEEATGLTAFTGEHWSKVRFYAAEMVNGLEYMHRSGVVHRDIKPENILLTADGHLKFVDFGTAKDLVQTDLNGPEFVGTAEYMCPSVVRSKETGIEADLWALGVVIYQLIMGFSPFSNPSPYLTFLRIKRGLVRLPAFAPAEIKDFISRLLEPNGAKRIANASGVASTEFASICYDTLRGHGFFTQARSGGDDGLKSIESFKAAHERSAVRVPLLSDLCIRAVGSTCVHLAEEIAKNGGIRPKTCWMQAFNLQRLSEEDRGRVAHYLSRRSRLHNPGVYRLFWPSVVDARSSRVDPSTWDYIGYDREAQGQWTKDFFFAFLADPLLGYAAAHSGSNASAAAVSAPSSASVSSTTDKSTCVASGCEAEVDSLRAAISAINRLRPRFVVMAGNFTYRSCDQVTEESSSSLYESQLDQFRKTMARVSETIPVLYVPGPRNVGEAPTPGSLAAYSKRFGNHFYGFWYGGLRCLVINSPLLANPTRAPAEAAAQEKWLAEEIELGKFNSTHLAVFSHHPWFVESPVEGELLQDEEAQRSGESPAAPSSGFSIRSLPPNVRRKWLNRLHHNKVRFVFTAGSYCRDNQLQLQHELQPQSDGNPSSGRLFAAPSSQSGADINCARRSFRSEPSKSPKEAGGGRGGVRYADEALERLSAIEAASIDPGDSGQHARGLAEVRSRFGADGGRRCFPHELRDTFKKLSAAARSVRSIGSASKRDATSATPAAADDDESSDDSDSDDDDDEEEEQEKEEDEEQQPKIARKKSKRDGSGGRSDDENEEEFANQDAKYEGPWMVATTPLAGPLAPPPLASTSALPPCPPDATSTSALAGAEINQKLPPHIPPNQTSDVTHEKRWPPAEAAALSGYGCPAGVRIVTVREDECYQEFYPIADIPKIIDLAERLD